MNKAGRFTALCASMFAAISLFQPTTVIAEKNYKDHDITPFTYSDKELKEVKIDDIGISVYLPSSWEVDKEYDCYYPGKEDESVSFYYFESSDAKHFNPKTDIDDVVDYFLNDEPELIDSTLSSATTEYYKVGNQFIAKTSYDVTIIDDGTKVKWKEINYIIPANEKYIVNINITLDAGKKQSHLKEEEALILTLKDHNKKLFNDYINTYQTQAAAIGSVTRNTGTTTVTASTPAPTPQPVVNTSSYVLNTNTRKFHFPGCSSANQIKSSNRWDVEMTRDEVIAMGYVPCKRCNP